jgi:phosphoesterase RecJ-like protein
MSSPGVPAGRIPRLDALRDSLLDAERIALTTHVNADGDGTGSQGAVAAWLTRSGRTVCIANPTPFPATFRHLIEDPAWIVDTATEAGAEALRSAQLLLVLDTGEPARIGRIATIFRGRPHAVLDHHLPSENGFEGVIVQDDSACATGELVYDLLLRAGFPRPWPPTICEALYTAILTDTGSFRFSNTSPRAHGIAADLLAQGVDPEAVYRRIHGNVPLARVRLLRHALDHLETDDTMPITWIGIERGIMEELGTTTDDLEGILEHARSVQGTEVALLFREMLDGSTKVSLRSTGRANVNAIARLFGGGGHEKASGALIGQPMHEVRPRVLEATRNQLRDLGLHFRTGDEAG